jgi:uncharacterized membrane protein
MPDLPSNVTALGQFLCKVGASGSVSAVIQTAPTLFVFCTIQIAVHLGLLMGAGRLLGFTRRDVLLASNANVGGKAGT